MFPVVSNEANPARVYKDRAEAQKLADVITSTPRHGEARVQFSGYYDGWLVEVRPRSNPYGNPAVVRVDGAIAKYH